MKYFNYVDIPNWKTLQAQLIEHKNRNLWKSKQDLINDSYLLWWCYFADDIKEQLPDVYAAFQEMGLHVKQLIYFTNMQNDLSIADNLDPKSVFIHIDRKDEPSEEHNADFPELTNFEPTNALNIPLEYCEGSLTLFYKQIDHKPDVYYPQYNCGGIPHDDVTEVARFELDKPAVLRISVPHAVHNPHDQPRSVATFRFEEDLEEFLRG